MLPPGLAASEDALELGLGGAVDDVAARALEARARPQRVRVVRAHRRQLPVLEHRLRRARRVSGEGGVHELGERYSLCLGKGELIKYANTKTT